VAFPVLILCLGSESTLALPITLPSTHTPQAQDWHQGGHADVTLKSAEVLGRNGIHACAYVQEEVNKFTVLPFEDAAGIGAPVTSQRSISSSAASSARCRASRPACPHTGAQRERSTPSQAPQHTLMWPAQRVRAAPPASSRLPVSASAHPHLYCAWHATHTACARARNMPWLTACPVAWGNKPCATPQQPAHEPGCCGRRRRRPGRRTRPSASGGTAPR